MRMPGFSQECAAVYGSLCSLAASKGTAGTTATQQWLGRLSSEIRCCATMNELK